jgi:antibiotic biosynthesis monooxygenase (ABM) superfamily enzyme
MLTSKKYVLWGVVFFLATFVVWRYLASYAAPRQEFGLSSIFICALPPVIYLSLNKVLRWKFAILITVFTLPAILDFTWQQPLRGFFPISIFTYLFDYLPLSILTFFWLPGFVAVIMAFVLRERSSQN